MRSANKTKKELIDELESLRKRISELDGDRQYARQSLRSFGERRGRSFQQIPHMHEAIFVIFDRKFEFVNDRFTELFGILPEEAGSPNFDPMSLIAPESRSFIRELYREACRGVFRTKHFNYIGLSKDRRKIECEAFILLIPYKWGVAIQGTLRSLSVGRRIDEAIHRCHSDLPAVFSNGSPVQRGCTSAHQPGPL
jgi:PAS domain-containing protein